MFFSLRDRDTSLNVDALAHPWPNMLCAFHPLCLIALTIARMRVQSLTLILMAPRWTKAGGDNSPPVCPAVAPPIMHRPPVSGKERNRSPPPRPGGSLDLAVGIPPRVVTTIQNARASSMHSLYNCKWQVFEEWFDGCSVSDIFCFFQYLMDYGKSFSTIKVYLAAIAACYAGFDGTTVGHHPHVQQFIKGFVTHFHSLEELFWSGTSPCCWRLCPNSLLRPWGTFPLIFCP